MGQKSCHYCKHRNSGQFRGSICSKCVNRNLYKKDKSLGEIKGNNSQIFVIKEEMCLHNKHLS